MRTDLYQGHDYYLLDELLTEEHKLIRETAREWVKKEVSPIIEDAAEKCEFPRHLLPGLGEIGAFGPYIPSEYGGPGLDQISYGIIMQELERCDSGLRSTASVQSSLVMYPIWRYGTEEQKQKYLPKLATGEMMGCFGLTEPDHGSDATWMETRAEPWERDGVDGWLINGEKMWNTGLHVANYDMIFARTSGDDGAARGISCFLVPTDVPGFKIEEYLWTFNMPTDH
ncbi:MAG: acyl-CoA dehydrogenase family protein, partial [Flavobacteriales bacterium]